MFLTLELGTWGYCNANKLFTEYWTTNIQKDIVMQTNLKDYVTENIQKNIVLQILNKSKQNKLKRLLYSKYTKGHCNNERIILSSLL